MLIVGTRGRSLGGFQGLMPGSVSKYCLQHSPVPVIVVRPNEKREKKKRKRQDNPARKTYMEILNKNPLLSTVEMMQSNSSRGSADITPSSTPAPRESTTSVSESIPGPVEAKDSSDGLVDKTQLLTIDGTSELTVNTADSNAKSKEKTDTPTLETPLAG